MTTLYLSRLTLNPRQRAVQRDLADCHNMHRRILSAFPDEASVEHARERFGVLYRVEQALAGDLPSGISGIVVLVQSRHAPDWSLLPDGYCGQSAVKDIGNLLEYMRPGHELRFRVRVNPVKRISARNATQGAQWAGKRVDLRREEDQRAWLDRKSRDAGFRLMTIRAHPQADEIQNASATAAGVVHGSKRGAYALTFRSVVFDGTLRVVDAERFRAALVAGIGPGKAYGFGLLSVAPLSAG